MIDMILKFTIDGVMFEDVHEHKGSCWLRETVSFLFPIHALFKFEQS